MLGEELVGFLVSWLPPPQEERAMAARTNAVTVRDRTARLLLTLRSFFEEGREPTHRPAWRAR
jgi:hypothetical protein